MKQMTEREIKDLLTPREMPTPPAGLAERIKREIPEEIAPAADIRTTASMARSRVWLMAASVVVAVGGGFLAYRLMEQLPAADSAPVQIADAGARAGDGQATADSAAAIPDLPPVAAPSAEGLEESLAALGEAVQDKDDASRARSPGRQSGAGSKRSNEAADPTVSLESSLEEAEVTGGSHAVQAPESEVFRKSRAKRLERSDAKLEQELDAIEARRQERQNKEYKDELVVTSESLVVVPAREALSSPTSSGLLAPAPASPPPPPASPPPPPAQSTERPPAPVLLGRAVPGPREKGVTHRGASPRVEEAPGNARIELKALEEGQKEDAEEAVLRRQSRLESLPVQRQPLEAVNVAPGVAPSTGGTAEPNDAPFGDVFFDSAGTNPFIDTEDDALSTFGLDVDTGSYTVARRYLRDGHLPPSESVRVEEFINYFDYGDSAPEEDDFAIHAEGAPSIYGVTPQACASGTQCERYHLLRFNLSGREISRADRRPALLTFVVDVSGSMSRENRLGLVKQALALLIDQLRADDRIALVIYGSRGQVVLEPTGDHLRIRRAIEQLRTGGSTNAEEGLTLAYELAARHRRRGAINRVILCSDGVANVGNTSAGSILDRIRREADQGIELTTVGFGMGNYNDTLMERLADDGNGRYAYVDTLDEARRIFVENLTGTLQTLAAEARVQVDFNAEVVSRYRLLGYENRDIPDQRFRDDTVDAGEIGAGHTVTALYEIKLHRKLRSQDEIGTLRLRYGSIAQGEMVEVARTVTGADFARRWDDASPALRLTSLVAEYAEILKHSYWAREGDLEDVFRRAQKISASFEGDHEVADFVSLVGRAAKAWERE